MKYYPIHLNIAGKDCAIIGGGQVATRKIKLLLKCGANIFVFSTAITEDISKFVQEKSIVWKNKTYLPDDLKKRSFFLVICATDDSTTNRQAAIDAKSTGALVDVVDDPEL